MAKIKTGPKVKRKGGGVPAKRRAVDALAEQLRGSTAVIVTDYRGLKVGELQDLRKRLRPKGVEYHVVKNSLFTRAAAKTERSGLESLLTGPTAVALGSIDEVELAKGMVDEARLLKSLRIVGAFIGGAFVAAPKFLACLGRVDSSSVPTTRPTAYDAHPWDRRRDCGHYTGNASHPLE